MKANGPYSQTPASAHDIAAMAATMMTEADSRGTLRGFDGDIDKTVMQSREAVGHVVANRVAGGFSSTPYGVATQGVGSGVPQFSAAALPAWGAAYDRALAGLTRNAPMAPDLARTVDLARGIATGSRQDITKGATFFVGNSAAMLAESQGRRAASPFHENMFNRTGSLQIGTQRFGYGTDPEAIQAARARATDYSAFGPNNTPREALAFDRNMQAQRDVFRGGSDFGAPVWDGSIDNTTLAAPVGAVTFGGDLAPLGTERGLEMANAGVPAGFGFGAQNFGMGLESANAGQTANYGFNSFGGSLADRAAPADTYFTSGSFGGGGFSTGGSFGAEPAPSFDNGLEVASAGFSPASSFGRGDLGLESANAGYAPGASFGGSLADRAAPMNDFASMPFSAPAIPGLAYDLPSALPFELMPNAPPSVPFAQQARMQAPTPVAPQVPALEAPRSIRSFNAAEPSQSPQSFGGPFGGTPFAGMSPSAAVGGALYGGMGGIAGINSLAGRDLTGHAMNVMNDGPLAAFSRNHIEGELARNNGLPGPRGLFDSLSMPSMPSFGGILGGSSPNPSNPGYSVDPLTGRAYDAGGGNAGGFGGFGGWGGFDAGSGASFGSMADVRDSYR